MTPTKKTQSIPLPFGKQNKEREREIPPFDRATAALSRPFQSATVLRLAGIGVLSGLVTWGRGAGYRQNGVGFLWDVD